MPNPFGTLKYGVIVNYMSELFIHMETISCFGGLGVSGAYPLTGSKQSCDKKCKGDNRQPRFES